MFKGTREITYFKTVIEISKYIIGKEVNIELNDFCRNICMLVYFVYIQSFIKFNNLILISFSKSKNCIKTLSFNINNTSVIFEIFECFFKRVITFIVRKVWNTWNLKFLDYFWKKVLKTRLNSLMVKIISFSSVRFIFSFLENVLETAEQQFPKCSVISNFLSV